MANNPYLLSFALVQNRHVTRKRLVKDLLVSFKTGRSSEIESLSSSCIVAVSDVLRDRVRRAPSAEILLERD